MTQEPEIVGDATGSQRAVFLSYASQDATAAARICAALRAAGIEVWFDQSALRGGDAWDAAIRKQIRTCALFIPVLSRNTHARDEGYFRLEWKLAVDRSHLMAANRAFLLPVVIDDTRDDDERVPDRFRDVQWTRLPDGATPGSFAGRVLQLLAPEEPGAPQAAGMRATGSSYRPPMKQRTPWGRRALLLGIALVAIAVAYFVADRVVRVRRAVPAQVSSERSAQTESPGQTTIPEKSIAVLPFVDLSEKKDQEYFSDGLSEELIDLLTKVPDLRVPARTSSFFFKGKSEDIATIAQKLRVAHVLEGSVRKAGNTIRVTAQLIRADNGYHLWSETYDRDLKDVFKVQDEIAGAVVAALKLKLAPGQQAPSAHRTSSTEAYNQYLLGRQVVDRTDMEGFRRATAAFRKAIELDPGFAAAYAELASAEFYVADESGDEAGQARAVAAADKAIALAPQQADGYATRGFLRFNMTGQQDWTGAQADFEKALALDPGNSAVQRRYGLLLGSLGRLSQAIATAKKATELDPLSSTAWTTLGGLLTANRQFAVAGEAIGRALEIQPGSVYGLNDLVTLQLLESKPDEALATSRKITDPVFRLAGISMAEHSLGHARESQQALEQLIADDAQDAAYQVAEVYAWRGEKDKAFEWLERAYQQHDGGLSVIKHDLDLASLRSDARYAAMLRKLQLPE